MSSIIPEGRFLVTRTYRSKNGKYYFKFEFVDRGHHIDIYCTSHPSLMGRDSNPRETHLYDSGRLCFVVGKEPRTQQRAEDLASNWAEYFVEYIRTGIPQI
jgi:hypothetical protein